MSWDTVEFVPDGFWSNWLRCTRICIWKSVETICSGTMIKVMFFWIAYWPKMRPGSATMCQRVGNNELEAHSCQEVKITAFSRKNNIVFWDSTSSILINFQDRGRISSVQYSDMLHNWSCQFDQNAFRKHSSALWYCLLSFTCSHCWKSWQYEILSPSASPIQSWHTTIQFSPFWAAEITTVRSEILWWWWSERSVARTA